MQRTPLWFTRTDRSLQGQSTEPTAKGALDMATKPKPLDKFVVGRRGPIRMRKSGAGLHDSRPNRERSKGDARRAAIQSQDAR